MNKKFSTLVAGALLAGGLFSNAYADNWATSIYVANSGKYHMIEQTGEFTTAWANAPAVGYCLSVDAAGKPVLTKPVDLGDKNAYWTVKTRTNAGRTEYQLVNANGTVLSYEYSSTVKVEWFLSGHDQVPGTTPAVDVNVLYFYVDGVSTPFYLKAGTQITTTPDVWEITHNTGTNGARGFDIKEIAEEKFTADDLNYKWDEGFYLNFKGYNSLEGNVFTGKLKAVATTNATQYYFKTEDNKYVVLNNEKVWSDNTATLDGRQRSAYSGYKFETVSEHAFAQMTDKANATFTVFKSYDFNNTDSLIVTLPVAKVGDGVTGTKSVLNSGSADAGLRVFVQNVDSRNYVTVIEYEKANDKLAAIYDDAYGASYEVGALAPYIEFGVTNIVDYKKFAGKVWNITDENGNVLTPMYDMADIDNFEQLFAPEGQFDLTAPEGQWLPLFIDGEFGFVNRESGQKFQFGEPVATYNWVIRSTETEDLYEVKYLGWDDNYDWKKVYIKEAKDAELGKTEKGYAKYNADEESLNGKYLSFETALGVTAYVGKNADDEVILTANKAEAIEFRIKQIEHDFTEHDGPAGIDTLMHITTYSKLDNNNNWTNAKDTLQFYHYSLYDHFSEKHLSYNTMTKKFELSDWSKPNNNHEDFNLNGAYYAFVVKQKADGTNVIIRDLAVERDYCHAGSFHQIGTDWNGDEYTFSDNYFRANIVESSQKLYAASQPGTLASLQGIYNYNDNDRISIENVSTPEYMTVTMSQDTVKISRFGNANFMLFEQNNNGTNFLAMEHVADVKDMKAAMLADTAYVRYNTYRPQYLLGVGTNIHVEEFCSRPDIHEALHKDTVYGRFLVNLVDSAYAYGINKKSNPYIWDTNEFHKLGFVEGFHTEDYLYLTKDGKKTGEKIFLGDNTDKVCTFAFRYVNEDREGVKIETAYGKANSNGLRERGWVKYHNGIPVVINDYEEADVFTVNAEVEEAPTANDEIAASEASIIAANGSIIVKGAAGKTVAISNILGQTIANAVVSSDNETIAVPAGIAVVAVEGEEAVKVVVK